MKKAQKAVLGTWRTFLCSARSSARSLSCSVGGKLLIEGVAARARATQLAMLVS
jgi:hypothetical protein